jgi:hypothetical protein
MKIGNVVALQHHKVLNFQIAVHNTKFHTILNLNHHTQKLTDIT